MEQRLGIPHISVRETQGGFFLFVGSESERQELLALSGSTWNSEVMSVSTAEHSLSTQEIFEWVAQQLEISEKAESMLVESGRGIGSSVVCDVSGNRTVSDSAWKSNSSKATIRSAEGSGDVRSGFVSPRANSGFTGKGVIAGKGGLKGGRVESSGSGKGGGVKGSSANPATGFSLGKGRCLSANGKGEKRTPVCYA